MRLSGMISGMDTDYVVSEMMKAERMKINRYSQNKQVNLWKQQDYQAMNKSIANFILNSQKNMGLKKTGSTGLMVNQSYKSLDYMRIAMSSNKDAADVRVRGKAENGSFNIEVKALAESSYFTSKEVNLNEKIQVESGEDIVVAGVTVFSGSENKGEGITAKELLNKINNNKELKDLGVSGFHDKGTGSIFLQGGAGLDLEVLKYDRLDSIEFTSAKSLKSDLVIGGLSFEKGADLAGVELGLADKFHYEIKLGEVKLTAATKDELKSQIEYQDGKTKEVMTIGDKEFAAGTSKEDIESYIDQHSRAVLKEDLNVDGIVVKTGSDFSQVEKALEDKKHIYEKRTLASAFTGIDGKSITDLDELIKELDKHGNKYDYKIKDGKFILGQVDGSVFEKLDANKGKTGSALINGVEFEGLTSNKINFNGLEIEMKTEGASSTITVDTNYDEIVDKITGLVDEYNSLLDEVAKTINQKRYRDYHPLSSDEKEAMKENDVKLWEEKAKSGMLNNDESLKRMLSNTRADIYKSVRGLEGSFSHITQIGITTEKYAKGTTGGKLQIDEEKLRKALEQDTDGVMELLFGKGKEENLKADDKGVTKMEAGDTFNGVFTGIYDNMVNSMKDIINKSGPGEDSDLLRDVRSNILIDFVSYKSSISDLDRTVMEMERKMSDLEVLLSRKEDGYYRQFTAMEKALQQMQSQSTWIGQQMM